MLLDLAWSVSVFSCTLRPPWGVARAHCQLVTETRADIRRPGRRSIAVLGRLGIKMQGWSNISEEEKESSKVTMIRKTELFTNLMSW